MRFLQQEKINSPSELVKQSTVYSSSGRYSRTSNPLFVFRTFSSSSLLLIFFAPTEPCQTSGFTKTEYSEILLISS